MDEALDFAMDEYCYRKKYFSSYYHIENTYRFELGDRIYR